MLKVSDSANKTPNLSKTLVFLKFIFFMPNSEGVNSSFLGNCIFEEKKNEYQQQL